MKKIGLTLLISLLLKAISYGQVKDISVTISPAAEYTLWDDKSGLEDGFLVGGKVGFGFGEYVELRGIYMQALDLQTNFEDFGLANFSQDMFTARDVKLTRIGGEFKANFGTKTKLNPYFTLGSGVQTIQLEDQEEHEQIFASLGLGAKFNIGKRAVFALEAKNTVYNFNSGSRLLTDDDKTTFGVTDDDFENERLSNWSAMASLQFYLGGRKPGTLSELDKAYLKSFSGGFSGLRFVFEPGLSNIKFDSDSNFRDTWMLGGYVGLDFNNYVGIRGFYYKSTKDEEISTDFDELAMYGAEFRARLNLAKGITPYLAIGGGYIDTTDDYIGKDGLAVDDSYFASGGIGINIPLARGLQAYGGVRGILTSNSNEEDLQSPDEIQTHTMYNFGLRFELGKKSKAAQTVYQENLDNALNRQQAINDEKLANLKNDYKDKIAQLESELNTAYQNKEVDKAVEILEEKKETEEALKEVEAVEKVANQEKEKSLNEPKKAEENVNVEISNDEVVKLKNTSNSKEALIQMTPVEFELLIQRILNEVENDNSSQLNKNSNQSNAKDNKDYEIQLLNQRIDLLEKLLLDVNANRLNENAAETNLSKESTKENYDMSRQILDKLDELNRKIERNSDKIEMQNNSSANPQTIIIKNADDQDKSVSPEISEINDEELIEGEAISDEENKSIFSYLTFQDVSIYAGAMLSSDNTLPVGGIRLNYAIANSKIQFVPELFFAFSDPVSYGLSANGILPININSAKFNPYAGAGLGFMNIEDNSKFNTNIIIGTYTSLLNGKLYFDYTTRNLFDYNQVSVGYKFNF